MRIPPSNDLPRGISNNLLGLVLPASHISRKPTIATSALGISTPTKDFPGIGASIRISLAAKANAKSSDKLTTRETFVPVANLISYFVIDGPTTADSTLAPIPKDLKVSSKIPIFLRTFSRSPD